MQVYCTRSPKAWISFCKTLMIHQGKKIEGNDSKGQGARVGWNLECMLWAEGGVGLKDLHDFRQRQLRYFKLGNGLHRGKSFRLPTKDRLRSWGLEVDGGYKFCNGQE
ncbi:hypothetical protein GQ457_07G025860 [Hibiscus cannabinus]